MERGRALGILDRFHDDRLAAVFPAILEAETRIDPVLSAAVQPHVAVLGAVDRFNVNDLQNLRREWGCPDEPPVSEGHPRNTDKGLVGVRFVNSPNPWILMYVFG